MKPTYIYGLLDPRDGKIWYVGKTIDPVARRREHLEAQYGNTEGNSSEAVRNRRVIAIQQSGHTPEMVILESLVDGWEAAERNWIIRLRSLGHVLDNVRDGGQHGRKTKPKPIPAPFRWWTPELGIYVPDAPPPPRNPMSEFTDMQALADIAMRLPRDLGLKLSIWNSGDDLEDVPVLGVNWEVYATSSTPADKYPWVDSVWGFTVEGPRAAARYLLEQLEHRGILTPEASR